MKGKLSPLLSSALEGVVLIAIVVLSFIAWVQYIKWYEDVIPVPPLPKGARLLRRQPELQEGRFPFYSAIARYWYYAKYSTPLPYEEVKAFYEGKSAAWPFGVFWVDILPPTTTPVTDEYDKSKSTILALPLTRDKDDPLDETIILVEVSKEPFDVGPGLLTILCFPFALVIGLGIIGYRYYLRVRPTKTKKHDPVRSYLT